MLRLISIALLLLIASAVNASWFRGPHLSAGTEGMQIILSSATCSPAKNCTASLNAALQQCKTAGASACTILLHGDVFYMEHPAGGSQWISISNMNNVFIGGFPGLGSKPLLEFQSIGHFFNLYTVTNFTMEGFDVDMARVPFTHATVTSVGSSTTTFQIVNTSMYPSSPADVSTYPYLSQAQAIIGYDPSSEQFRLPDINSLQNPYPVIFSPDGSTMTLQNIKLDVRYRKESTTSSTLANQATWLWSTSLSTQLEVWVLSAKNAPTSSSTASTRDANVLVALLFVPCRLQRTAFTSQILSAGALLSRTLSLRDKEMMV